MGNSHYKQYIDNSYNVTNEELKSFVGKFAKIECTVPDMKNDSFDYIEMEYGRITIIIYDTNNKSEIINCINSFYRYDQQMFNGFGKIESISIKQNIKKRRRFCVLNYFFGEKIYINYDIKIKLDVKRLFK